MPRTQYSVRMWENAGKMQTRITPNMDTFYTVIVIDFQYTCKIQYTLD